MRSYYKLLVVLTLMLLSAGVVSADTAYFRELVNKPNATCFDAYRIITVLKTGQDPVQPADAVGSSGELKAAFDGLRDSLVKDKIIPKSWNKKKADGFINRGEMAYMLFRTLKMEGGLTVRMFGLSSRYAFRECVDKQLMASGYAEQMLSGEELINLLDQAGKYQDKMTSKKVVKKPAEQKVDKPNSKPESKETKPPVESKTATGGQK